MVYVYQSVDKANLQELFYFFGSYKTVKPKVTIMLIIFLDTEIVVYKNLVLPGETINAAYNLNVPERFRELVLRVQKSAATLMLHHGNASSYTAVSFRKFLAKYNLTKLPLSPHCLQLAPANFSLFPSTKTVLKGFRLDSVDEIQAGLNEAFRGFLWLEPCLEKSLDKMPKCFRKVL